MLVQVSSAIEPSRNSRRERGLLHHEGRNTLSMGCSHCLDKMVCGGLQVDSPVFDCLSLCCENPTNCDSVCRRKPIQFAQRVREVQGFELHNVARASVVNAPPIPNLVPTILHGKKRAGRFCGAPTVCLPLYDVIARHDGVIRYADARNLADGFRLSLDARVILTGTATDPPLERWWSLGGSGRRENIRAIRGLGVTLVTTPNFSLFTDRPRWDDLHSMKRIAIVHEEFVGEGMPAALHLNARTDQDWQRWTDYIRTRSEVTHVAFELATGAGHAGRIRWHIEHLVQLAGDVNGPLHLVIRGGGRWLPALVKAFSDVTMLDTSAFVKTMKRQRAMLRGKTAIRWIPAPTDKSEPVDALLADNWRTVAAAYQSAFDQKPPKLKAAG
jgi:hypothetical protein